MLGPPEGQAGGSREKVGGSSGETAERSGPAGLCNGRAPPWSPRTGASGWGHRMQVHHINCGCMCPVGGPLFDGYSRSLTATLVCHCLLIETEQDGLVLVDTGFGSQDIEEPKSHLSGFFRVLNNLQLEHRYTAVERVRSLGFSPEDVRHILLTHLDFDHAGGLEDFPKATVHVMQREMDAARSARGFITNRRYRPIQWEKVEDWEVY